MRLFPRLQPSPANEDMPYLFLDMIQKAPELQIEILRIVMQMINIQSLQALRIYSQTRPLWKRRCGVRLPASPEMHWQFCRDVISFQVGRLSTHPGIYFGNISILQLDIFPGRKQLVHKFKSVLKHLRIQDLCIYCGEVPSFMEAALKVWAPSLQNLSILRIVFDRFSHKVSIFSPQLNDILE